MPPRCEDDSLTRVRPPGRTPAGNTPSAPAVRWLRQPILDLAGNLAEWVADAGEDPLPDHCALQPRDDPRRDSGDGWLYRGGSFDDQTRGLRVTARARVAKARAAQEAVYRKIGVRCVLEVAP
jgi:formylglycine-generating enzyme required for sulfatase activity